MSNQIKDKNRDVALEVEGGFLSNVKKKTVKNVKENLNVDEVYGGLNVIKKFLNRLINPVEEIRIETFDEAVARLNLTEKNIENVNKNYTVCFYVALCLSFVMILLFMSAVIKSGGLLTIVQYFVFMLLFSLSTIFYSFKSFQIRKRKLCSFNDFLNSFDYFPNIGILFKKRK